MKLPERFVKDRLAQYRDVIRYYGAGLINTAFGYLMFSGIVWLGANVYVAQIIAHVMGTVFNYFTYAHAFRERQPRKGAFVLSYVANYLLSLLCLKTALMLVPSPYIAGIVAIVLVSVVNYFILRRFAFVDKRGPEIGG